MRVIPLSIARSLWILMISLHVDREIFSALKALSIYFFFFIFFFTNNIILHTLTTAVTL